MIKIVIPCFFRNETIKTNELIGKETPYSDCEIKPIMFYNINAVSYYKDDAEENKIYACVHSNETEFISSLTVKEVVKIIDDAILQGTK